VNAAVEAKAHLIRKIDRRQRQDRRSRSCRGQTHPGCEIHPMLDRTRNAFIHHTMHVPRTMFAAAIDSFGGPE
jgi:hypothetical protein